MNRAVLALIGSVALAVPTAAQATTLSLTIDTDSTTVAAGTVNGLPAFLDSGSYHSPVFLLNIRDDAGNPLTNCLSDPATVRLVDGAGAVLSDRTVCGDDGGNVKIYLPAQAKLPTTFVAQIDTGDSIIGGQHVTAAQSNAVLYEIKPRVYNDSPYVTFNRLYPIKAHVELPNPRSAGFFALDEKVGRSWHFRGRKVANRFGRVEWAVAVRTHTYHFWRVRFVPKAGSYYVGNFVTFGVRRS